MIVTIPARQALLDTMLFTADEVNALLDTGVNMALSMLRSGTPLAVVRGYLSVEVTAASEPEADVNKKSGKKKTGKTKK